MSLTLKLILYLLSLLCLLLLLCITFPIAVIALPQPSSAVADAIQHPVGSLATWPAHSSAAYRYRHEGPSFPYFVHDDPQEFAMLKMALYNLLPSEEPEPDSSLQMPTAHTHTLMHCLLSNSVMAKHNSWS